MARVSAGIGAGGAAQQINSAKDTHPSVTFLMLLVVAEYGAYLGLRYFFRSVHGG
jgi:hypothetical protein